jgi:hypothetical protein
VTEIAVNTESPETTPKKAPLSVTHEPPDQDSISYKPVWLFDLKAYNSIYQRQTEQLQKLL